MDKEEKDAVNLLEKRGYMVKKMTDREAMEKRIMDAYDGLDPKGKKFFMDYVLMLAFCEKHRSLFQRFKMKA